MAKDKKITVKPHKKPIAQTAQELAEPVAAALGLYFWDVRFEKEGSLWFLRYYMDKAGGITIEDCEAFSRQVSPLLDRADPIEQSYYLEVSSPGVERELTKPWHYERCTGMLVTLRLIRPRDGERECLGELVGMDEAGTVTLRLEDGATCTFTKAETAYVRLFDDYDYSAIPEPDSTGEESDE